MTLKGSCLCGAVRFETQGTPRDIVACHCTQCRKSSGHFIAATSVAPEELTLVEHRGLKWYRSSSAAERGFCQDCGSTLLWKPASGDRISIFAGAIDKDVDLPPIVSHIFLAEKGAYYDVDDAAERHQATGAKLTLD